MEDLRKQSYEKDPKKIMDGLDCIFSEVGVQGIFAD